MEKSRSGPKPGETLELGFLGTVVYVEIPHTIDQFQLTETSSFNEMYDPKLHVGISKFSSSLLSTNVGQVLASCVPFHPPPLLLFEACLSNLWSIWECLILCEPILVFGQSPTQTSQAVWWLRDLIRPVGPTSVLITFLGALILLQIPLASDMRPYLTMQDSDLTILVNKLPPKAGLVIGVTNPFFEKSCAHWPHVLSLGKQTKCVFPRFGTAFLMVNIVCAEHQVKRSQDLKVDLIVIPLVRLPDGRPRLINAIYQKTTLYSENSRQPLEEMIVRV